MSIPMVISVRPLGPRPETVAINSVFAVDGSH
ncbi:hypothetical protein Laurelin_BL5002 [Xanthomonas phage Laurelin]|nr:hypothetical protein Laurelin_BL5002 [Xanthomonas phage Laurelin]